jgi:hypothetical protein
MEVLMNASQSVKLSLSKSLTFLMLRKDALYVIVFVLALFAFEAFNYSTTDFALSDLLGELRFAGIAWSTLLSIAFCGIDFAGIALLLAAPTRKEDNRSTWFMFGAWILAATMNAILTWWGVVLAIQSHPVVSAGVVDEGFVTRTVPVFIALMVWVLRILLVGSLSKTSDRQVQDTGPSGAQNISRREFRQAQSRAAHPSQSNRSVPAGLSNAAINQAQNAKRSYRPEPTYIPMQDEAVFHSLKASGSAKRRV